MFPIQKKIYTYIYLLSSRDSLTFKNYIFEKKQNQFVISTTSCHFSLRTIALQKALSSAKGIRSSTQVCGGASISREPLMLLLNWAKTAWNVSWSLPPRRICPSHRNRIFLRRRTKFKLVERGRASCWIVLPVKEASMRLFAPLMRLITFSLNGQDSQP